MEDRVPILNRFGATLFMCRSWRQLRYASATRAANERRRDRSRDSSGPTSSARKVREASARSLGARVALPRPKGWCGSWELAIRKNG